MYTCKVFCIFLTPLVVGKPSIPISQGLLAPSYLMEYLKVGESTESTLCCDILDLKTK